MTADLAKRKNQLCGLIPPGTPLAVANTLTAAIADLGIRETRHNAGPEIEHLIAGSGQYWWHLREGVSLGLVKRRGYVLPREAQTGGAWCAMAVSNWIRTGLGLPYWDLSAYCVPLAGHPFEHFLNGPSQIEDWAQSRGCWRTDLASVPSGAVCTMGRAGSGSDVSDAATAKHVLLCVLDHGDTLTTIEGNVGDSCESRRRSKAEIRGWAKWW